MALSLSLLDGHGEITLFVLFNCNVVVDYFAHAARLRDYQLSLPALALRRSLLWRRYIGRRTIAEHRPETVLDMAVD